MENKEEKDKEILDELRKQVEEEQMRLHPEIYKPTNDEVVNN